MLVDFCYLYPEWQKWLKENEDNLGSPVIDGQPHGVGSGSSPTEELALKRSSLTRNIQIIEEAAQEAGTFFATWLLKDVTTPEISYQRMNDIPCGRRRYFEMRKKFFRILDKKI